MVSVSQKRDINSLFDSSHKFLDDLRLLHEAVLGQQSAAMADLRMENMSLRKTLAVHGLQYAAEEADPQKPTRQKHTKVPQVARDHQPDDEDDATHTTRVSAGFPALPHPRVFQSVQLQATEDNPEVLDVSPAEYRGSRLFQELPSSESHILQEHNQTVKSFGSLECQRGMGDRSVKTLRPGEASCYGFDPDRKTASKSAKSSRSTAVNVDRSSSLTSRLPGRRTIEKAFKKINQKTKDEEDMSSAAKTFAARMKRKVVLAVEAKPLTKLEKLNATLATAWYQFFIAFLICSNSIYMGYELNYMIEHKLIEAPIGFAVVNCTYTVMFILELALRIAAEGRTFLYAKARWAWNWVDSFIVLFSVIEDSFTLYALHSNVRLDGMVQLGSIKAIRVMRVARLLRILRITRLVRTIGALQTLTHSILCTLKSLVWAILLLLVIIYVFALLFTQAAGDYLVDEYWIDPAPKVCNSSDPMSGEFDCVIAHYFKSVPDSMFTLFKSLLSGISWDILIQPLQHMSPLWAILFSCYITFTYLAVMNVVTGVFCQSAIESAQHDHDLQIQSQVANKSAYIQRVKRLFNVLDTDGSGKLTFDELDAHILDEQVMTFLESLQVSTRDVWILFSLLDEDNSQEVDLDEFVSGILRLHGFAKSIDMAKLMHDVQGMEKTIKYLGEYLRLEISELRRAAVP